MTLKTHFYLLPLLLLNYSIALIAQTLQPRFEQLTIEDGLSANDIFSIYQDSIGLLWLAVKEGLFSFSRLDSSVQFFPLPVSPELSEYRIFEDRKKAGNLWLDATGGIVRIAADRKNFTHFPVDVLPVQSVYSILENSRLCFRYQTKSFNQCCAN